MRAASFDPSVRRFVSTRGWCAGIRSLAVIVTVAFTLGACSSDDTGSDSNADTTAGPDTADAGSDSTPTTDGGVDTTEEAGTAAGPGGDEDVAPVCDPLAEVAALSEEIALLTNDIVLTAFDPSTSEPDAETLAGFEQLADELDELLPDVLDAYARAEEVADPEIASDIALVAEGTEALTPPFVEAVRSAESFDELDDEIEAALQDPDLQASAQEAGVAALRLDEFTVPECGFQLSNG